MRVSSAIGLNAHAPSWGYVQDASNQLFRMMASISEEVESSLLEDREEAKLCNEACASGPSVAVCKRVASHVADMLMRMPGLNWAAFGETTGGASLVVRSVITHRRVDFKISSDGRRVASISVDENLSATSRPLEAGDRSGIRELVRWVNDGA